MAAIPASEWQARGRGDSSQAVQAWCPECGFLESTEQLDPGVQVSAILAFSAGRWEAESGKSPEAHGSDNLTDPEVVRPCLKQGDKGWLTPQGSPLTATHPSPTLARQGSKSYAKNAKFCCLCTVFCFQTNLPIMLSYGIIPRVFFESLAHRFPIPR